MPAARIHVVAGVLFDAAGRVLVAQRPGETHLGGLWEFPGGKLAPGESREAGLSRELAEEIGIRVLSARPLILVEHAYPDRDVVLDVWKVESFAGEPYGREGQRIEWRGVQRLDPAEFPPADVPVLAALRLPPRYLVTPEPGDDWGAFLDRLAERIAQGFELVQLRAKSLDESALVALARRAAEICRHGGATLLVNADPATARRCGAGGVHLTSRLLARIAHLPPAADSDPVPAPEYTTAGRLDAAPATGASQPPFQPRAGQSGRASPDPLHVASPALRRTPARPSRLSDPRPPAFPPSAAPVETSNGTHGPDGSGATREARPFLVGASCHDADDLDRARVARCDFAVLGPVRATPTHPGAPVLDWRGFERLVRAARIPVFAIGGLGDDDIAAARRSGGQGVAAVRAFWEGGPSGAADRSAPACRSGGNVAAFTDTEQK